MELFNMYSSLVLQYFALFKRKFLPSNMILATTFYYLLVGKVPTCSVCYLYFSTESNGFDLNFKVFVPIKSVKEIRAWQTWKQHHE